MKLPDGFTEFINAMPFGELEDFWLRTYSEEDWRCGDEATLAQIDFIKERMRLLEKQNGHEGKGKEADELHRA